jgi:hypothetical protein
MKKTWLVLAATLVPACALADAIDAPSLKPGDTWVYQDTVEKGSNGFSRSTSELSVVRTTTSGIYYTSRPSGSAQPPHEIVSGPDWSRIRNINGTETTINKPLSFPLKTGRSWNVQYAEQHPSKEHKLEQWSIKYTVVGTETVDVPAGKFSAIKIEAEGTWVAEIEPRSTVVQGTQVGANGSTTVAQTQNIAEAKVTGRAYKAFWYVPEMKRWVKAVEEYYSANGVRNERYTNELVSFKPA